MVIQQKTGRPVQFEIAAETRANLLAWLERRGGTVDDFAFPSRVVTNGHLSTRQYARLVDEWVPAIGLMPKGYGTHSLRRTKASLIYKATGNLRAIQILLGHSKIENTVRYLGVDVDDALALSGPQNLTFTAFVGRFEGRPLRAPCRPFTLRQRLLESGPENHCAECRAIGAFIDCYTHAAPPEVGCLSSDSVLIVSLQGN